ncbi:hypothetical protein SARC_12915, partial [Sphaeroforma arctica JP610]
MFGSYILLIYIPLKSVYTYTHTQWDGSIHIQFVFKLCATTHTHLSLTSVTQQELLAENALLQKNVTRLKKTLADTTAQLSDITRETETFRANQTKMNSELSFHKDKTSLTSRHLTRARAESMNLTKESQSKDKDIEALNKRIKKLETQLSLMTRTEPSLTDIDAEREELLVLREEKEYLLDYLDQMISVLDGKPK